MDSGNRSTDEILPWSWPRVLLGSLTVTVLIALVVAASTSGVAFGAFNPAWDGSSTLQSEAASVDAASTVARETTAYSQFPANNTIAVVLSPTSVYSDEAATQVRTFVRQGGTVVVAEDYRPHSNALLAEIGATARVDGRPLRDERHNYRSPAMPVATNVSDRHPVAEVPELTLNHGTAIQPHNATVLLSSSPYGYLDANRNGDVDENETLDSFPVVSSESVGQGQVIVVSDPSILINAMVDQSGNRAFIQALFAGHDRVLLDYSYANRVPPLAAAVLTLRESAVLQVALSMLLVGAIAAWVGRPDIGTRLRTRLGRGRDGKTAIDSRPVAEETLVSYVRDRHPEWAREQVEGVVRAVRREED